MRFIGAHFGTASRKHAETFAKEDELVIPCYPNTYENQFISIRSLKLAPFAKVISAPELIIDTLTDILSKNIPGLPRELHEMFVFESARLAHLFPIGTRFKLFNTYNTAKVKVLGEDKYHQMWDELPIKC